MGRVSSLLFAMLLGVHTAAAADFVWIEGEKPSSSNVPVKAAVTGNPQWLSEKAWLSVTADAAANHFSLSPGDADLHHNSCQPLAVLCRQWNWTFGGGSEVPRTLKVFNNTQHPDPIEAAWKLIYCLRADPTAAPA